MLSQIRELFPLVSVQPGWKRPEFVVYGKRLYRGRDRYVAGYGHGRIQSGRNGAVYDRILGYGDTQEAAIEMMRRRLTAAG